MTSSWQNLYQELTEYVAQNPQIKLGHELIDIPEEYRPGFYQRFNAVRTAFVINEFSPLIELAGPLQDNYSGAEGELMSQLSISRPDITPQLRWFITDPVDGLQRAIYDLLFDLLRDKIKMDSFVDTGRKAIISFERKLQQEGYQNWAMLSLINLLKPRGLYHVSLEVGSSSIATVEKALHKKDRVNEPETSKKINLVHCLYNIFIVPDFIIFSPLLNKYVSIRSEVNLPSWSAVNASENIEWLPLDNNTLFTPGLILVYTHENLNDLALIRDAGRLARPDLAIVCRNVENWWEDKPFEEIDFNRDVIMPRLGMHIVSRQAVPVEITQRLAYQEMVESLETDDALFSAPGLTITDTGFDSSGMKKFVNMLVSARQTAKP